MTATVQAPLVQQPDNGVIFLARRRDLRLVKVPRYPIYGQSGQKVGEHKGEAVQFREGRFFCPSEGKVTLEDGREADAAEIKQWLESHRLLRDLEEGFWAVETKAPPVSSEEMAALNRAAVQHDVETIEAMVAQERAGWGREDFIATMEATVGEIEDVQARVRAEIEAEKAAAKPAARGKAS